jgi:hypothetical protein
MMRYSCVLGYRGLGCGATPCRIADKEKTMKLWNKPRNREYAVGRHRRRLQRLLADRGFKMDMRNMVFIDANQFVDRAGPYWVAKAIDPKGREVSLSGRFRMRELRAPLLVTEVSPYEFEVFLPPKLNES